MTKYEQLVSEVEKASEEGVTLEHAERVAALSLSVMNTVSVALKEQDKDRRMRKRGLKAIKSAVRLEEIKNNPAKKPTEGQLDDAVNLNELVAGEEAAFDSSEVDTAELDRQFGIAKECHVYFRGIAKGRFE
jgi:hypothetical protein